MAGRRRWRAHRRLPSITMAMCRGTEPMSSLDGEDLFLFGRADLVGHEDVAIGELLQLRLQALHVVGRDARALFLRAHLLVAVTAQRPDLDPTVLDLLVEHLHEVPSPFLIQRR